MLDWVNPYNCEESKDERFISFAGDVMLQKGFLESAMALYTSVDYSDNYQQVMTAVDLLGERGKGPFSVIIVMS